MDNESNKEMFALFYCDISDEYEEHCLRCVSNDLEKLRIEHASYDYPFDQVLADDKEHRALSDAGKGHYWISPVKAI